MSIFGLSAVNANIKEARIVKITPTISKMKAIGSLFQFLIKTVRICSHRNTKRSTNANIVWYQMAYHRIQENLHSHFDASQVPPVD